jgi:nucleoside-diphosphate-sugar epimerase
MNLLVLGGSGFLSGTIAHHALAQGHDVTILTRGRKPVMNGVRMLVADRDARDDFERAISAAGLHWDLTIDCIGFNADHALQDLSVIGRFSSHLVFISTDCVLDGADRPWCVDETYGRFEPTVSYGMGKRSAEVVLLGEKGSSCGMPITILRPCHIYGEGSLLGCLPRHGRDPELISKLRRGDPLHLVGGGCFLQQPVDASDLASMALGCLGNPRTYGEIFHAGGPDIVASRDYYRIIADALGVPLRIEEVSVRDFLEEQPNFGSFCCHRVFPMDKARKAGLTIPATPLQIGLQRHLKSLLVTS